MRGLIRGSAGLDQPVKDDRNDDDTPANADQAGEQSGSSARNHAQEDQPKGAHRARICQMNWNHRSRDAHGPAERFRWPSRPEGTRGLRPNPLHPVISSRFSAPAALGWPRTSPTSAEVQFKSGAIGGSPRSRNCRAVLPRLSVGRSHPVWTVKPPLLRWPTQGLSPIGSAPLPGTLSRSPSANFSLVANPQHRPPLSLGSQGAAARNIERFYLKPPNRDALFPHPFEGVSGRFLGVFRAFPPDP